MRKLNLLFILFVFFTFVSTASALTVTSLEIKSGVPSKYGYYLVWDTLPNSVHWILGVSEYLNPPPFENSGDKPFYGDVNFEFNPGESIYLFSETGRIPNGAPPDYFSGEDDFTLFVNGTGYTQFNIFWDDEDDPTDFLFGVTQVAPFTLEFLGFGYEDGSFHFYDEVQTVGLGSNGSPDAVYRLTFNAVPEPTTVLLLGIGLIGLAGLSRRKFLK